MRVAQKIAKLVDGSAWLSASNAYHRWRHPIDPQDILKDLDLTGFQRIHDKFSVPGERTHWPKYLDADRWLPLEYQTRTGAKTNRASPPVADPRFRERRGLFPFGRAASRALRRRLRYP